MDDFGTNPLYEKVIDDLMIQKYSIVEDFFTKEDVQALRNSLLAKYGEETFRKSAIGNKADEKVIGAIRGDFILWLDEGHADVAEGQFFARLNNFKDYLNRTCFMGINEMEFHYAVYTPGTFYKRHLDTFQNDSRRKLSMVCYLNNEDWKPEYGGELTIYTNEDGEESALNIYPVQGRMVVFESQVLEHEVKPVQKERLSITGWLKTRA